MKSWSQQNKWKKFIIGLLVFCSVVLTGWFVYARENQVLPQSKINDLGLMSAPVASDKILIFSPHPDDETIAAAGYIYDATKVGATVEIVLVTDGNKHGLRDQRYQEFKDATTALGVLNDNLIFLGHPDGALNKVSEADLKSEFQEIIADFNPNIVIYSYLNDQHPDHAYTGKIADEVSQGNIADRYQYLVHANYYPQPQRYLPNDYLMPPQKLFNVGLTWLNYSVTTETESEMAEAVSKYQTQLKNPFIKILFYSTIRKNELFIKSNN